MAVGHEHLCLAVVGSFMERCEFVPGI